MKTWKKCAFIGILAIIVFAFIACDGDDGKKGLEDQSDTITILTLSGNFTATVKGRFSDNDWSNVPTTIANAFTNAASADFSTRNEIVNAFGGNNVIIMVEKGVSYQTWKVVQNDITTLYLNVNGLNGLQSKVKDASNALHTGTGTSG